MAVNMAGKETEVEGSTGEYSIDSEDQLQPEDTLVDSGVDDVLDAGIAPEERSAGIDKFGVTAAEQAEGESLDRKLAQEVPDVLEQVSDDVTDLNAVDAELLDEVDPIDLEEQV
ncbi:hypothetical protein JGU71_01570 [Antrihabitans sp. YC3-6]|uniref:Uncharacterized protein n=1 Tax=Antrihabitans stalagmiti TaxID=2799499 RepID=A0A934NLT3_9NOCA|nr:hypothetical protein [Antrihabitans stalagmiti]